MIDYQTVHDPTLPSTVNSMDFVFGPFFFHNQYISGLSKAVWMTRYLLSVPLFKLALIIYYIMINIVGLFMR